jgi:hypothetical protein
MVATSRSVLAMARLPSRSPRVALFSKQAANASASSARRWANSAAQARRLADRSSRFAENRMNDSLSTLARRDSSCERRGGFERLVSEELIQLLGAFDGCDRHEDGSQPLLRTPTYLRHRGRASRTLNAYADFPPRRGRRYPETSLHERAEPPGAKHMLGARAQTPGLWGSREGAQIVCLYTEYPMRVAWALWPCVWGRPAWSRLGMGDRGDRGDARVLSSGAWVSSSARAATRRSTGTS